MQHNYNLIIGNIALSLLFLFVSCSNNQSNSNSGSGSNSLVKGGEKVDVPYIDPGTIGNVRIGIVSRDLRGNVILVNRSNKLYLKPKSYLEKEAPKKIEDLEYWADTLSYTRYTSVSILEDQDMAQILGLLQLMDFYRFAKDFSQKELTDGSWPKDIECIFAEINGKYIRFMRPSKFGVQIRPGEKALTNEGRVYYTIRVNIIEGMNAGKSPFQSLINPLDDKFIYSNLEYLKANEPKQYLQKNKK